MSRKIQLKSSKEQKQLLIALLKFLYKIRKNFTKE